ncbi:hypothetical protein D3C75_752810 [compost metagenome]
MDHSKSARAALRVSSADSSCELLVQLRSPCRLEGTPWLAVRLSNTRLQFSSINELCVRLRLFSPYISFMVRSLLTCQL